MIIGIVPGYLSRSKQSAYNPSLSQSQRIGLSLLHENGFLGSILKGLFGYKGNPSLLEVLFYGIYIISVTSIGIKIGRKTKKTQTPYSTILQSHSPVSA